MYELAELKMKSMLQPCLTFDVWQAVVRSEEDAKLKRKSIHQEVKILAFILKKIIISMLEELHAWKVIILNTDK